MTRIFLAIVATTLLGACGGDETGGGTGSAGGGDDGPSGAGGASPAVRAAVEDFCDAGCACAEQGGTTCSEGDRAECVGAYLGYELPGDAQCDARTIAAFECATGRQAACDEQPVTSLESCEADAGGC